MGNGKWGTANGERERETATFCLAHGSSVVARTACKVHVPPLSRCSQFWHPWYEISAKPGRIALHQRLNLCAFCYRLLSPSMVVLGMCMGESSVDSAGTIDLPLSEKAATPPTRLNHPI